jgi:hypothetical protein
MATGLAALDLVVSALAALALYKPFGTGGIVAGTGIGTTAAVVAQAVVLRGSRGEAVKAAGQILGSDLFRPSPERNAATAFTG